MKSTIKVSDSESEKNIGTSIAYIALILSVLCRSLALVFAKYAAHDTVDLNFFLILINPWYWAELWALGFQTYFWLYVLRHIQLSVAYPVMSLVFAVNLGWSSFLFNEFISTTHIIGCSIIIVGVIMAAPSRGSIQ